MPLAVAGDPLLLRASGYVAVDEGVGHPASAGPAAVLMENDVALNVHAAEGYGLRDGPLHGAAGGGDGEVFGGAPEGGGGVVVARGGVGVDVAGDVDAVGRGAEAEDLGVEADGDVDVVVAGKEEEGVAFGAELVAALDGVDLVDLRLDRRGGSGRVEEEDVGAEVRGGSGGCNRRTGKGSEQG